MKYHIERFGLENIYNSDQSGFQLEMHRGRSLAIESLKNIECEVQSISATTHSYTIQPVISADGRLLSPLFIVLNHLPEHLDPEYEKQCLKKIIFLIWHQNQEN